MVVVSLLLAIAASRWLAENEPAIALRFNPASVDARANLLVEGFKSPDVRTHRDELAVLAREMIALAPGDARGYSFLASLFLLAEDAERASEFFKSALRISPTERIALTYQFQTAILEAKPIAAASAMDVLLRRYPREKDNLTGYLPYFLASPEAVSVLEAALRKDPPWRRIVMRELLKSEQGTAFVATLLLDEQAGGRPIDTVDRAAVVNAIVEFRRPAQAYRFFLSTLNEEEREHAAYIYDGNFEVGGSRTAFDWTIRSASGAEVRAGPEVGGGAGLKVRFRDSPTRLGTVFQLLALPPGTYRIVSEADALQLVIPKDLYWVLSCQGEVRGERAKLAFSPGRYKKRTFSADFTIPANGCPLQRLRLETGVRTDSWRIRYSGELTVRQVAIERLGA